MPISEKIKKKIENLNETDAFKKLMLDILAEEDKGNHRFKEAYEKRVNTYLKEEDGDS